MFNYDSESYIEPIDSNIDDAVRISKGWEDYFSHPYISNSDLVYFHKHGYENFRYMKASKPEKRYSKAMYLGSMLHKWILERDTFYDEYVWVEGNIPTSENAKRFCSLVAVEADLVIAYNKSYKHNYKNTSTILGHAEKLYEEYKDFIEKYEEYSTKIPIKKELLDVCKEIEKKLSHLWEFNDKLKKPSGVIVVNEHTIYNDELELKGKLDKIIIDDRDPKNFKATIIDLKTTFNSHNTHFSEVIKERFYHMQLALYRFLFIGEWRKQNPKYPNTAEELNVALKIYAIQTTPPYSIEIYTLSKDTELEGRYHYIELSHKLNQETTSPNDKFPEHTV